MSAQLVFDLAAPPALGRDDFFVSDANRLAVDMLARDGTWPQGKLILTGPPGSGKSHLAGIWAAERGALTLDADRLTAFDPGALPAGATVLAEDADRTAGDRAGETALFHLHNAVLSAGGHLLLTARTPPRDWGLTLPDLASRMEATARAALDAPDDALLSAVMVKLFADRQLAVPPNVVAYLTPRIDRSFAALNRLVRHLDDRALSTGRAVTRVLAAEVLADVLADTPAERSAPSRGAARPDRLDSPGAAGPSSPGTAPAGGQDAG